MSIEQRVKKISTSKEKQMKKNFRSCYLQPHIFYRIKREKMKKNDDAAIKCQHNSQLKPRSKHNMK